SMSLLNHDCQPNCVMIFKGKRLTLRAVRVIRPCEELTISYTDVLAPSKERRSQLQEQYHFLCQCTRCTTEDKHSKASDDVSSLSDQS
ncbi:Histone-lysine N-methyltransferase SMYD3, partial [Anabarilius grahami]